MSASSSHCSPSFVASDAPPVRRDDDVATEYLVKRRRAFTIIESLTVAAVCSVWMSIAMPYLQTARMGSQRVQCKNQLKQLGLAMHNYHDVYGTFPPGWNTRVPTEKGYATMGWTVSILPFIEQYELYQKLDTNLLHGGTAQQTAMLKTEVRALRCPSDATPKTNSFRDGWGTSNYVGNFGSTAIPRWDPLSGDGPGQVPSLPAGNSRYRPSKGKFANGILAINSKVGFRYITDGTSNTFMIGERSVTGKAAIWPGPRSNFNESDVVADGSFSSTLNQSATSYGSRHSKGGINIALCDGSVRTIAADLESKADGSGLLQKLSARNDGMIVGEF
ncbi:MAG: DUF1559 domain-containing protein [Fuerstiella sp.]